MRNVPCVAGCDGPMLTYIGSVLMSGRTSPSSKSSRDGSTSLSKSDDVYGVREAPPCGTKSSIFVECLSLMGLTRFVELLGHVRGDRAPLPTHHRVILAQRMSHELVVR